MRPPDRRRAEPLERPAEADNIEIVTQDARWSQVEGLSRLPSLLAATLQAAAAPSGAGVVIALADDTEVRALNARFRGKDAPTNVLSFPASPAARRQGGLGDVILAYETCLGEAEALGIPAGDHACHLAVHGVLHLLGHDHGEEDEAHTMEALETRLLAEAGIADPYATPGATADDTPRQDRHRP